MAEPLKYVYSHEYLHSLVVRIQHEYSAFKENAFIGQVFADSWEQLALKARTRRITQCLKAHLPADYAEALAILKPVAEFFSGYEAMFFPDFVACFGLDADWSTSMDGLAHFTRFSSSEFAVRPFIERDTKRMMAQMLVWANHPDEHIRRLASEGARPRLPWASALPAFKADPSPSLPILERLKADSSAYVRKSVANHLNDISKDHPDLVMKIAHQWQGHSKQTDWILKHGCRTLLKQGDSAALEFFQVGRADHLAIQQFKVAPTVALGETLFYSFVLLLLPEARETCGKMKLEKKKLGKSEKLGKVRVEMVMHFLRARGQYRKKVFQVFAGNVSSEQKSFERSFSFKPLSTRRYYPGLQRLEVVVNGVSQGVADFQLTDN